MFQSFDEISEPGQGLARLSRLREEMAARGLDGFLVPRADAHQGEYVAPCDARLGWLTGFTGSAGFCAVLAERAAVFADGRYKVQLREQIDMAAFEPVDWPATTLADWLVSAAPAGSVIGYDGWLHTRNEITTLRARLERAGMTLRGLSQEGERDNLVDRIWSERPAPPAGKAYAYPEALAGLSGARKREIVGGALADAGQETAVLTLPESLCWLLNIRGADLARVPVVQGFGLLHASGELDVFADPGKFDGVDPGHGVRLLPPEAFTPALEALAARGGKVRVDPGSAPEQVFACLEGAGATVVAAEDPCLLPKACKTPEERAGAMAAQEWDGHAMVRFLAWLDREVRPAAEDFTEIDVVRKLEALRSQGGKLRDISFDTICGSGPNGAIVHYRVTTASNRRLSSQDLLLVDSGGQYLEGTTDITRTIALGTPDARMRACYTRVLRGLIAVSRLRFPKGRAGRDLDAVARAPLWEVGLDYDHGTGHGVGAYLSVHEGPQRLAPTGDVPLREGMILSNEPGYYLEGAFGIRLENLILVEPAPEVPEGDAREMYRFVTLTWVPFDRRLIDTEALTQAETAWLNSYHAACMARAGAAALSDAERDWLNAACAPL